MAYESKTLFKGKTLLITGGTGSFGNVVLKHFLDSGLKEIRIFSRDEKKQHDMRCLYQNSKISYYIGDVRDYGSIYSAMQEVDYVFCAAALKQVPSCEFYPLEAVKTNILGIENTLNAAIVSGVQNVVVLSTDKAVYPINAMGMTKAVSEKIAVTKACTLGNRKPTICVTRYGNVMASRGSVIPLFIDQMKSGKSITITDGNMTRFMMTLDDAVDLVIFAFNHGVSGDTFVQQAPSATIEQLARVLKKIFNSNSKIITIGTRHGEKKHETLVTQQEMVRAENMQPFYRIPPDARGLDYNKYFVEGQEQAIFEDYTSKNTHQLADQELERMLLNLDYVQDKLKEFNV